MKRLQRALESFRRKTNIETQTGYLGDGTGETHDRSNPGNYWVRYPAAAGGLTAPVSLPLMVNANLRPDDGIAVEVGLWKNRTIILGMRLDGLAAAGINPIQLNPADPTNQYLGPVNQDQITTFKGIRHADLANKPFFAYVLPGFFYVYGVPYFFPGGELDLISFQPATGEHCFTSVFIKTDLTLEAFASTAISDSDPLSDVDIQEADALKTVGSYPAWAWEMRGDDTALTVDPARQVDLRQAFGLGGASALDDLTDVTLTSVAEDDILVRGATDWNNLNIAASQIVARLATGHVIGATVAQIKTLLTVGREALTAARTYYVRTDGSDSNTGLTNSSGGAFLTWQHAVDVIQNSLDLSGYDVTVQAGNNGTWTGAVVIRTGWVGKGTVQFLGDTTTPGNVLFSVTGADAISLDKNARLSISGIKLSTTTSGNCVSIASGSHLDIDGKCEFGACAGYHIVTQRGSRLFVNANYDITGGATSGHYAAVNNGVLICTGRTITLSGTLAFGAFILVGSLSSSNFSSSTFTGGTITGTRYILVSGGAIAGTGGGANFFPGSVAGTNDGTGIYQ